MSRLECLFALTLAALPIRSYGTLLAAAGKVDITPDAARELVYMAGYGPVGRKAEGVHDPLYARILVISDGKKTLAFVGLDFIGFFRNQVQELRKLSGFDRPGKFLFVVSTHDHSGPDTLGLWGPWPGVSGVDPAYLRKVETEVADGIRRAAGRLKPAQVYGFEKALPPAGLCRDSRDPVVIDPYLAAVQFRFADKKAPATLIRWSCHAEVLGYFNRLLTADFPGALCADVEKKTGGDCLFVNGIIGGLLTPDIQKQDFSESLRVGTTVAEFALKNLKKAPRLSAAPIHFKARAILIPIENSRYLLFLHSLVFGHKLFRSDGSPIAESPWKIALEHALGRLKPSDRPWVKSEVSLVRLGSSVTILGIPGELFPELALGGYDGRFRFGHPLVKPDNPNPPELSKAPRGPYLWSRIPGKIKIIAGLADDEIGYIIPGYDFKVNPDLAMAPRPKGDHYEETNSIGPSATGIILSAARALLAR